MIFRVRNQLYHFGTFGRFAYLGDGGQCPITKKSNFRKGSHVWYILLKDNLMLITITREINMLSQYFSTVETLNFT